MHPKNRLHGKIAKQAIVHHALGAGTAFFGRLKNSVNRTVEVLVFSKVACRVEQHRGVTVVPAAVHLARVAARVIKRIELLHRQCVDIGAQSNCPCSCSTARDDAHYSGPAQAAVNGNAPFL